MATIWKGRKRMIGCRRSFWMRGPKSEQLRASCYGVVDVLA